MNINSKCPATDSGFFTVKMTKKKGYGFAALMIFLLPLLMVISHQEM